MEKVKINVAPNPVTGEVYPESLVLDLAAKAGWSDDPMDGHAVLLPDENGNPAYEVLNPLPVAPPIGWTPTPPIEELIRQSVKRELDILNDDEEIDDIIDAEDFEVDDELPPLETMYEVIAMTPEAPRVKEMSPEERAQAQVEYEEVLEKHRRLAKVRSRKEYDRRVEEARRLYGDEPPEAPKPSGEEPS